MGLNPGGDPEIERTTVFNAFQRSLDGEPRYSAYVDEYWAKNNKYSRHQKNVQKIASVLGHDIRNIFSANFIFVRSRGTAGIRSRVLEIAPPCWQLHLFFLSVVRPKTIICLGNNDGLSAFSLLLASRNVHRHEVQFVDEKGMSFRHGKYCDLKIQVDDGSELNVKAIGIPHPSWHNPSKEIKEFLEKIR